MDIKLFIWTLMAAVGITRVDAQLRCIECLHISWRQTTTTTEQFSGVSSIYQILRSKYNPACAQRNPYDRNEYNRNLQQKQQLNNGQFFNANYDIGTTICADNSARSKCHYLYGNASIFLPSYNGRMVLNIHVRNCQTAPKGTQPDQCYTRSNQHGNQETRFTIRNLLTFLSYDVEVEYFDGQECYCDYDNLCTPHVAAARNLVASSLSILLALVLFVALS